jgi:hypothetical protein
MLFRLIFTAICIPAVYSAQTAEELIARVEAQYASMQNYVDYGSESSYSPEYETQYSIRKRYRVAHDQKMNCWLVLEMINRDTNCYDYNYLKHAEDQLGVFRRNLPTDPSQSKDSLVLAVSKLTGVGSNIFNMSIGLCYADSLKRYKGFKTIFKQEQTAVLLPDTLWSSEPCFRVMFTNKRVFSDAARKAHQHMTDSIRLVVHKRMILDTLKMPAKALDDIGMGFKDLPKIEIPQETITHTTYFIRKRDYLIIRRYFSMMTSNGMELHSILDMHPQYNVANFQEYFPVTLHK